MQRFKHPLTDLRSTVGREMESRSQQVNNASVVHHESGPGDSGRPQS